MGSDPFIPVPAVSLGALITTRRRELGRSQRDLADLLCAASGRATVTRTEISRYERETRIPASGSLWPLAAALRLPVDLLRQAATLARHRRHLSAGCPELLAMLHPGYLVGFDPDLGPQPMILIAPAESVSRMIGLTPCPLGATRTGRRGTRPAPRPTRKHPEPPIPRSR